MMPGASGVKLEPSEVVGTEPGGKGFVDVVQQRLGHLPMRPGGLGLAGFQHGAEGGVDLAQIVQRGEQDERRTQRHWLGRRQNLGHRSHIEHVQNR